MAMKDNKDVACYFITKHSWKGRYKRIFSVGTCGITTYNPSSMEITNQWPYDEFISITPSTKSPTNNEFVITMKKGQKKTDTMKFSTEHRADLLTAALKYRDKFAEKKSSTTKRFNAMKKHWSEAQVPVILEVTPCSLDQRDPATNRLLCSYEYKDMEGIAQVSDYSNAIAIIHGGFSRLHLFSLEDRNDLIQATQETASLCVGVPIKQRKDPITLEQFMNHRLGKYSSDEALTSHAEFMVQKLSPRHGDPVRRLLCLTETCLVEHDPDTYNVVTCKPLCDIFAIVRNQTNLQEFSIEFVKGAIRTYSSTARDALIASILDGVRASGNRDVHVKMMQTNRGHRLGPFTVPVDEEVESQHMKFVQSPPAGMSFSEAVSRFNNNVSYNGLLHAVTADGLFAENKERLIHGTLSSLLDKEGDQTNISSPDLEAQFHALRRLVASKAGFQAFTQLPKMREKVGLKVVKALRRNDHGVTHAAIDMLCCLMQPMHDDYDLRQEQLNKASIMSSKKFLESLMENFKKNVLQGSGALVITAMLDFLTFGLCAPYSETTDGDHFDTLLDLVAQDGRMIFKLFQHPSMAIVKGAGLVMKAVIEEGDAETAAKMQDLALAEGALPKHLHTALFTESSDNRMLAVRQLSQHLVGLWVTGHPTTMALLKRIMPAGLLSYLDSEDDVPADDLDRLHIRDNVKLAQEHENRKKKQMHWKIIEQQIDSVLQHWRARIGLEDNKKQQQEKPIVLRKRRQRIKSEANWKMFHYQFTRDHSKPNLIWNYKTREELRNALEDEIHSFTVDKDLSTGCIIAWNHQEFEVQYQSLSEEIKIGDYYLRLLLEEDDNAEYSAIKKSYEFFSDLYHRFLLSPKISMKCLCLQAMAVVYSRCHEEIGAFNDTKYVVGMLDRCTDRLERDRLINFLHKLILNKRNVKDILDANGVRILVDLLTLAHLHTTRAVVPMQSNLLEASPEMQHNAEKEWYYGNMDKERLGPYSLPEIKELWDQGVIHPKTRCWAQGMDGWRPVGSIPQLKWSLLATGQAVYNETDLATLILNMLIKMCDYYPSRDIDDAVIRPLPKIKRVLSDSTCLPHIVQLLMTFDPVLVEKVATLLYGVMQDNPALSRLYLSGAFFFIMMYTGSNVLPIARFLKYAHLKQAFMTESKQSASVISGSVMGQILPEAMVCYLENYEAEKFATIFLGEFDTPEAIWNNEMRRMMIEKIAAHLADFTPRLQCNTRALYQYCPIPAITFPQLENELFCSIYYLRHLCDTKKFKNWPIKDPIKLLKDILDAWKYEVEKKPPSMSTEEAYHVLNLEYQNERPDESQIRKAYFRLAQKYHPDKNPNGREIFENVNKAYEFLCHHSKIKEGPNPENIVLILQAQCILFSHYKQELTPYKYAGYPMLIKTIKMETVDEALFSKSTPILNSACELCYHTVNTSALNAEELRRERGIEVLQEAFSRCVSILNHSSKENDIAVRVCCNIARCYAVSSQFEGCREKIQEMSLIVKDICRILYFKNLPHLCCTVVECIGALAVDLWLQTNMYQCGVLWHLLQYLFNYDYTLEEGGIDTSEDSNQQELLNKLAKRSLTACARLGGYLPGDLITPENPSVRKSLRSLLTPYIAKKLSEGNIAELLKLLNGNSENPYLIWDNSTRAELVEFLREQEKQKIRTGECDPSYGADFVFTIHSKELIIGEVFVRIYNEQPSFVLENSKEFTIDLLDYLGSQAQYLYSLMSLKQANVASSPCESRLKFVEMALEALQNVLRSYPGVEIQCIGHFKLLFSLFHVDGYTNIQYHALQVVSCVTGNQECVNDIAASDVLTYLLLMLQNVPECQQLTLETLNPLMSSTKLLKEALNKGMLIYLLELYCNSTNPKLREQTAELFAKTLTDKLVGPKVRIILSKFLPPIFMDAMRDSAEASVHMFEGIHENPELIWNKEARNHVCSEVSKLQKQHYAAQHQSPDVKWSLNEDFTVVYSNVQGEIIIGGVYLRLFIANPSWVLRRPMNFITELLEKWTLIIDSTNINGEVLEMVTIAVTSFCSAQPAMLEKIPQLGYIPKIFAAMSMKKDSVLRSAVKITNRLAHDQACLQAYAQCDCIGPLKSCMKQQRDVIGLICDTLQKIFESGNEVFVEQALSMNMVDYLVGLLECGLDDLECPAAIKAHIVKTIKAMQSLQKYEQQISTILEKRPVWNEYKTQKHDLFLSDKPAAGYLTGPGVAGYLTASSGHSDSIHEGPPPM